MLMPTEDYADSNLTGVFSAPCRFLEQQGNDE